MARSSNLRADLIELAGQRPGPQLELGPRFFQPPHVGFERAGALDQGGMHGPGFGGAAVQFVDRLARVRLTALRRGQPLVGQRWSCSSRAIDSRASSCRRSSASRSSSA